MALELLNNAGINPHALPRALEILRQYEESVISGFPQATGIRGRLAESLFMKVRNTHPETRVRIIEAESEITRHRYEAAIQGTIEHAPTIEFVELLRLLRE